MRILLATHNPHKAEEIAAMLQGRFGLEVLTMRDLPEAIAEPVEDGATLEENAYIKAREIQAATGMTVIADDTGLEVDALNGAPGVFSARFSGENATYESNCRLLLEKLDGVPQTERTARFRSVLCWCDPFRSVMAEGSVEGTIAEEMRGKEGFGYDPLFTPEGSARTFAEMSPEEKNATSHRGRAIAALEALIAPILADMESGERR